MESPICKGCGKTPAEIEYYKEKKKKKKCNPDLIAFEDGTYNPKINKFLCNECYIKFGMPLGMVKE